MGNRQKLQQAAVKALQADIENADATGLEFIGHSLIQVIEGGPLIHRGLNADAKPVGYTVDSFSTDRKVVAEYSTLDGYFEEPFKKPIQDCAHAKEKAPDCVRVYLVSNKFCENSTWEKLTPPIQEKLGEGVAFEVYDSRRLATEIYDRVIGQNNLVEYLGDFLPSLWKVWTENLISHSAPEIPREFVHDPQRAEMVADSIEQCKRVALQGISGTGKTYTVIEYVHRYGGKYRNVLWLAGNELAGVANLSAVRIARLGVEINLASQLRTSPCLLIIDDWKEDTGMLANLLPADIHPETRVVITCIQKPGEEFKQIEIPILSPDTAATILTYGFQSKPDHKIIEKICNSVGFHPLTLAVIRDTVRETDAEWEVIVDDLHKIPHYEGQNHETILQRILLNHSAGIADELCILRWLDVVATDSAVALEMLGPAGMGKVLGRSIVRKDSQGMCRMHDLMRTCIQHYNGVSVGDDAAEAKLWRFFEKTWGDATYHFQRALQIHRKYIIGRFKKFGPRPGLEAYLFLLLEDGPFDPGILAELRNSNLSVSSGSRASSLSIIEAIERSFHIEKVQALKDKILEEGIANITSALAKDVEQQLRVDLLHHRGKLLFWKKCNELASLDFEECLKLDSSAFFCDLQLARIKAKAEDEGCCTHIEKILNAFVEDVESVAITLVLAAFAELEKKINAPLHTKWISEKIEVLRTAILLATAEGFSQPYRTLGGLGRHIYYEHPDELIRLMDAVSFPPAAQTTERECFEIAECMKSVGKACAEVIADNVSQKKWLERALEYYNRNPKPNDFQLTMKAECLIRLELFDDALSALDQCDATNIGPHWWHRRAQALMGCGKLELASTAIENALRLNENGCYESTFLQVKARIQAKNKFSGCIQTIQSAIEKADHPKFRMALERDLREYQTRFQ